MFAHVNGVQLWYEVEGSGMPLMVVSGAGSQFYQRSFSPALRRHVQYIFVELRGSGRSTGRLEDVTFDVLAADLDAVRQVLNLERIAVLGHSAHGFVATAYAATYLPHTSHLVLLCALPKVPGYDEARRAYWAAHASEQRKALYEQNRVRLAAVLAGTVSPDEALVEDYAARSPLLWYDPNYDSRWLWAGSARMAATNDYFWRVLLPNYDPTPSFPRITCPVFIAVGRYDFAVPPTLWETAKDLFPNATLRVFDRSGHNPQLEEPAFLDATLLDWLTSTAG